jgi:uncharacterized membrane protein YeaQ/YmgE (transglycosylase-associated protein family)
MENPQFLEVAEQWANTVLIWVGFGTLAGLLAKAIMPGKDPGGAVATLAMGIAGTIIGCGVISFFWKGHVVSPISPLGFFVATGGAFVLLFFYKLLGGYYFKEDQGPLVAKKQRLSVRRTRQPAATVVLDDEH